MFCLRLISPALLDFNALSCKTLATQGCRTLSSTAVKRSSDNKDYEVNPVFQNRNPRTLEHMGLMPKRKGWQYTQPRKDWYHVVKLTVTGTKTYAWLEHSSGAVVLDASTQEKAVAKHLYSMIDVSASWNIGRLLARRMLEAGITNVTLLDYYIEAGSIKKKAFIKALQDSNIELEEPEVVEHEFVPGINYDGYHRVGERKDYQQDYQKV